MSVVDTYHIQETILESLTSQVNIGVTRQPHTSPPVFTPDGDEQTQTILVVNGTSSGSPCSRPHSLHDVMRVGSGTRGASIQNQCEVGLKGVEKNKVLRGGIEHRTENQNGNKNENENTSGQARLANKNLPAGSFEQTTQARNTPRVQATVKRVQLTARDRSLLQLCFEQGFLTFDHVASYFFSGVAEKSVYERLQELERAGFIVRFDASVLGRKRAIRITSLGEAVIEESVAVSVERARRFDPVTATHDAWVTTMRFELSRHLKGCQFVCEQALKQAGMKDVPDGVFFFENGSGLAIELENSIKGTTRFKHLLLRWRAQPNISAVLYIATQSSIFEALCRTANSIILPSKIAITTTERILNGDVHVDLIAGSRVHLSELVR